MKRSFLVLVLTLTAAGCGGGSDESSDTLQTGVYAYELTEQYLLDNAMSQEQAKNESGMHETTLGESGSFSDTWPNAETGATGRCSGTYEEGDGNRVTFKWVDGCYGDWAMTYSIEGDQVTWSDIEALPPYDSEEDQKVSEVFNGIPWTRTGDAP